MGFDPREMDPDDLQACWDIWSAEGSDPGNAIVETDDGDLCIITRADLREGLASCGAQPDSGQLKALEEPAPLAPGSSQSFWLLRRDLTLVDIQIFETVGSC